MQKDFTKLLFQVEGYALDLHIFAYVGMVANVRCSRDQVSERSSYFGFVCFFVISSPLLLCTSSAHITRPPHPSFCLTGRLIFTPQRTPRSLLTSHRQSIHYNELLHRTRQHCLEEEGCLLPLEQQHQAVRLSPTTFNAPAGPPRLEASIVACSFIGPSPITSSLLSAAAFFYFLHFGRFITGPSGSLMLCHSLPNSTIPFVGSSQLDKNCAIQGQQCPGIRLDRHGPV